MSTTKTSITTSICLLAAIIAASPVTASAQDAEAGRRAFHVCAPCHVPDADTNKLGPHLKGVFGRVAAGVEGFRYSEAMRKAGAEGLIWDEAALSEFLASPKHKVPGTSMRFWGFWSQSEIDAVITYLRSNP